MIATANDSLRDSIRRWNVLAKQHRGKCVKLASHNAGPIQMAMGQQLLVEFKQLSFVLAGNAEAIGLDATPLILFRQKPNTCQSLDDANVVVERLAHKLLYAETAKDSLRVPRGEKTKDTEKRVRKWLIQNHYTGQNKVPAKSVTVRRIQKELAANGHTTSVGTIVKTSAWKKFEAQRKEVGGGKKARRVGVSFSLDNFPADPGADGAEDADTTIERLTAEQRRDDNNRKVLNNP